MTSLEINSRYLEVFKNLEHEIKFPKGKGLKGIRLLVEKIEEPELKSAAGIILKANPNQRQVDGMGANTPQFYMVLQVGEGYTDETGEIRPGSMDAEVGDIVIISRLSVHHFSAIPYLPEYAPDTIGYTNESDIIMNLGSHASFQQFFNFINEGLKD